MLFWELCFMELIQIIILIFLFRKINMWTVWYLSIYYLFIIAARLFFIEADLYVGFLILVDSGVFLIFIIFSWHIASFIIETNHLNNSSKSTTMLTFSINFMLCISWNLTTSPHWAMYVTTVQTWYLWISTSEFYLQIDSCIQSALNVLHEINFLTCSFEFTLVIFTLFYGIIGIIFFYFLTTRIIQWIWNNQLDHINDKKKKTSVFFIRSQDLNKQQATSTGLRTWIKNKNKF